MIRLVIAVVGIFTFGFCSVILTPPIPDMITVEYDYLLINPLSQKWKGKIFHDKANGFHQVSGLLSGNVMWNHYRFDFAGKKPSA